MIDIDVENIRLWIEDSISVKHEIYNNVVLLQEIARAADLMYTALANGNKIMACGNGGSSSDSAHFVGELLCRLTLRRTTPLPAIDLTAMNAAITAIANDYNFDYIFKNQIRGLGKPGDILLAISTSGMSKNILQAVNFAIKAGIHVVFLTGNKVQLENPGNVEVITLAVPSKQTALIQESHIMILHIIANTIDSMIEMEKGYKINGRN